MEQYLDIIFWAIPVASLIALLFAYIFYHYVVKQDEGSATMKEIAGYVREGAFAYLKQQYKVVAYFFIAASIPTLKIPISPRTSFLYSSDCSSNNSKQGIDTTRTDIPFSFKCS